MQNDSGGGDGDTQMLDANLPSSSPPLEQEAEGELIELLGGGLISPSIFQKALSAQTPVELSACSQKPETVKRNVLQSVYRYAWLLLCIQIHLLRSFMCSVRCQNQVARMILRTENRIIYE